MKKILIFSVLVVIVLILFIQLIKWIAFPGADEISDIPIDLKMEPIQRDSIFIINNFKLKGYNLVIKSLAVFQINGIVVSSKKYFQGIDGNLVPMDVGICWGEMTNDDNLKNMKYQQYLRFLLYKINGPISVSMDYIISHATNIHIIPQNKKMKTVIRSVKKGDKVQLYGYLVTVRGTKGNYYYTRGTSLSRTDTGDGACELLYLIQARINNKIYK